MRLPAHPLSRHGSDPVVAAAALAQVATIVVTWGLWQDRTTPVPIPVVDALAPLPFGPLLVVSALGAVIRPRIFGPLQCALVALAVLADQTRLQPEIVSLAMLMTAPAFGPAGRQLARWALAAMWLWAGIHKALSYGWTDWYASQVAADVGQPDATSLIATGVPILEISLGLTALWRRTWPVTRWGGAATHIGILLWLSPLLASRNIAVWPWNAALVVAAFALFAPGEATWPGARRPWGVAAALTLLLGPAAYYRTGELAYLSHHLYSVSVPDAIVCGPNGCTGDLTDTSGLRVPFPPHPMAFRARFERTCEPGDRLTITWPETRITALRVREHACPS